MLVIVTSDHLTTYRLAELDESAARFDPLARVHGAAAALNASNGLYLSLLPDGRVLAAGQKIHILDPPRDRLEKE